MLPQPVGLRVLLINVDLGAVDGGVDVGIAVDADKVIRRPAVGHVHARGKAGRVARAEDLGRAVAAQPHGKAWVGAQQVGKIHADLIVDVLLAQAVSLRAGVRAGRVVSRIDENTDGQKITSSVHCIPARGKRDRRAVKIPRQT